MVFEGLLKNNGESEKQYLDLVEAIMLHGVSRGDRTGTGTTALHGASLRFDLSDNTIPLLTTKFVSWKTVIKELLWFLSGNTNIKPLVEQKVHIWTDWPYKKYITHTKESLSLKEFEEKILNEQGFADKWGNLGPVYGRQWRSWEGRGGKRFDQVANVIHMIKHNPTSRRILFHGWNVADIKEMALPPCHLLYQFFVNDNKLSMTLYQRSCDVGLGLPFNLASAAFLINMIAQQCNKIPGELFWVGHDVHVYNNHFDGLRKQLKRTPQAFPKFKFNHFPLSIDDYKLRNFNILDYHHEDAIKLPIAV